MCGVPVLFPIDIWKLFTQKELKRLVAYARSSANLLTKLILQDQIDFYKWEVSLKHFSRFIGLGLLEPLDFFIFLCMSYSGIFYLQCLFRTPLNNYDAIILLHMDKLPYPQRLLFPSELNLGTFLQPFSLAVLNLWDSNFHNMYILCREACCSWEW